MTHPAMIERGDLKNKVRFAAMSKNEDMKKTEKDQEDRFVRWR